jgi:uncharacterized protein (TIGR02145 family)
MKTNRFSAMAVILSAFAFSACSDDKDEGGGVGCKDPSATIAIGEQVWLKCNLNVNNVIGGVTCYDRDEKNCKKYGSLYDYEAAMKLPSGCNSKVGFESEESGCSIDKPHRGICPEGFHIPDDDDWNELMEAVGGQATAAKKLRAADGWYGKEGTDEYKFTALPGGMCDMNGTCQHVILAGYWLSATQHLTKNALSIWFMDSEDRVKRNNSEYGRSNRLSVRCLKDKEE